MAHSALIIQLTNRNEKNGNSEAKNQFNFLSEESPNGCGVLQNFDFKMLGVEMSLIYITLGLFAKKTKILEIYDKFELIFLFIGLKIWFSVVGIDFIFHQLKIK